MEALFVMHMPRMGQALRPGFMGWASKFDSRTAARLRDCGERICHKVPNDDSTAQGASPMRQLT